MQRYPAAVARLAITLLLFGLVPNPELAAHPAQQRGSAVPLATPASLIPADDEQKAIIGRYCLRCHNDQSLTGNMTLEAFVGRRPEQDPALAEKMIRKLRAGMMPPPWARRPDEVTLASLAEWLETRIDTAAAADPNPGNRTFQRLNRAEYARSVRDLLGIDVDVAAYLPPDTYSHNFDNIADVQQLSATLMEGYLRAAGAVSRLALGDPDADPSESTYKVPRTSAQLDHVEGAPFGTRGGVSVMHNFLADGEYVFKIVLHPTPTGQLFGSTVSGEQIEVSVDGERVALLDIDPTMSESDPAGMNMPTAPISVRAGARRISAAFLQRFEGPVEDLIAPIAHTLADTQIGLDFGITTLPHLRDLGIIGPYNVTGVSDTASRRRVFTCRPVSAADELPCATQIVSALATQAYRRQPDAHDLAGLMLFYTRAAAEGGFEAGIRTVLQAILTSPHFVLRLERPASEPLEAGSYRLDDRALASRLSFFLWGAAPDVDLLELAASGLLADPAVLEAQVTRMLADPRAEALGTRFAAQWLRLQDLEKLHPDALLYPQFDRTLAVAMRRETELFFYGLVRDDRSLLELLTADYTFVNARLARHYGIPNVVGSEFRRVQLSDPNRRGLLGQGSILSLTSHANRTSPVLRGKWVMEVLLGSPPPPPPPNVPDLEATEAVDGTRVLTVREQMEQHRSNPACSSCHRMIDPIGLALENFDVTGVWRIKDRGTLVDTSGELYDGTPLRTPADLRDALLERADVVVTTFTENLLAYGLGRRVEYHDMPAIRAIVREAAANDYRLSSFIMGVVNSRAFRMSRTSDARRTAGADE